ncbi:hypothetical protein COCC4DRAFT_146388, partial [Bipolaris maydis ATCC 48331]
KNEIAKTKTYDSGYSPVVTHLTTNPPINCLSTEDQTGFPGPEIYGRMYRNNENECYRFTSYSK